MLIHLLQNCDPYERNRINGILSKERRWRLPREVSWVYDQMSERGSLSFARQAAREFLAAAQRLFEQAYQTCPENEHKYFLRALTSYVLERDN
jgi:geranylgeranyl pyrophosphate synthase